MFLGPSLMPAFFIVEIVQPAGSQGTAVAAALSLGVGIWSLIFGLLNLGFLFDLLSTPVVLGAGIGLGIVAYMGQVPILLGLTGVSPMLTQILGQLISKIRSINPRAVGIGASSIVLLVLFQWLEDKRGNNSRVIRIMMRCRNLFILIVYTGISFLAQRNVDQPLWEMVGLINAPSPSMAAPDLQLFSTVLIPSFILWFTIAMEHVVLAKALGRTRGYSIDPSQELVALGLSNIVNSFLGLMPVGGGDVTRAAIATTSGIRSPLAAAISSGFVAVALYSAGVLAQWIPLPAVAAIIIIGVMRAAPQTDVIGKYWKISFADFGVLLLTFDVSMLQNPELGVGLGFGASVFYTLFRMMFSFPRAVQQSDLERHYVPRQIPLPEDHESQPPTGIHVVHLEADATFLNAERVTKRVIDSTFVSTSGLPTHGKREDRVWNERRNAYIQDLRRRHPSNALPWLQVLIIDFSATSFIDASGIQAMEDIATELRSYSGPSFELRLVGLNSGVESRFRRAGWTLFSPYEQDGTAPMGCNTEAWLFDHLAHAIQYPCRTNGCAAAFEAEQVDEDKIPLTPMAAPAPYM